MTARRGADTGGIGLLRLPPHVAGIMADLRRGGFAAHVVGGCVRDGLLGREPEDWDVCTSARPSEIESCLSALRLIDTGARYGTLTALTDGGRVEITTFRTDGFYGDGRRPDAVRFSETLRDDLSRRDFTINAMAYDEAAGVTDPFDGAADLRRGLIRAVGEPAARFREDALRIMRALRFASVLDFSTGPETETALRANREALGRIAAERISAEFRKLVLGTAAARVLTGAGAVIATVLPETERMFGHPPPPDSRFSDLWAHTAAAVGAAPPDFVVRAAVLFGGVRTAGGSASLEAALRRLRLASGEARAIATLALLRGEAMPDDARAVKRFLNRIGEAAFGRLAAVRAAEAAALCGPAGAARVRETEAAVRAAEEIIARGACFRRADLAVNGSDMAALGLRGREIGRALDGILARVIDDEWPNSRAFLIERARFERETTREKG